MDRTRSVHGRCRHVLRNTVDSRAHATTPYISFLHLLYSRSDHFALNYCRSLNNLLRSDPEGSLYNLEDGILLNRLCCRGCHMCNGQRRRRFEECSTLYSFRRANRSCRSFFRFAQRRCNARGHHHYEERNACDTRFHATTVSKLFCHLIHTCLIKKKGNLIKVLFVIVKNPFVQVQPKVISSHFNEAKMQSALWVTNVICILTFIDQIELYTLFVQSKARNLLKGILPCQTSYAYRHVPRVSSRDFKRVKEIFNTVPKNGGKSIMTRYCLQEDSTKENHLTL